VVERRCVVQFLHPGFEPDVRAPGEWPWNTAGAHKRKFLVQPGEYRETVDRMTKRSEHLGFWGEWEPQSLATNASGSQPGAPQWLHEPFYSPLPTSAWAQNTDPFVFGDRFHFTGCQQHVKGRPTQLARLLPGSVILFGSGKKNPPRFLLDTLFVVGETAIDHNSSNQLAVLNGSISTAYREITIDRWYAAGLPPTQTHRLYFGAIPDEPVGGMFSFFPCSPLDHDGGPFPRPTIKLPGYVTPSQTQKYKLTEVGDKEAADVWNDVVAQVLDSGRALGVRADLPHRVADPGSPANADPVRC
jgi:hypothetical protein